MSAHETANKTRMSVNEPMEEASSFGMIQLKNPNTVIAVEREEKYRRKILVSHLQITVTEGRGTTRLFLELSQIFLPQR